MKPKQKFFVFMSVIMLFVFATGCMIESKTDKKNELTGVLKIACSDSTKIISEALKQGFNNKYPDVTVIEVFASSDEGIDTLLDKSSNIACISRNLTEDEKNAGIEEYIVHKANEILEKNYVMAVMSDEQKQNELVKIWFDFLNTKEAGEIINLVF